MSSSSVLQRSFDWLSSRSVPALFKELALCYRAPSIAPSDQQTYIVKGQKYSDLTRSIRVVLGLRWAAIDSAVAHQQLGSRSSGNSQGRAANSRSKTSRKQTELYCSGLVCVDCHQPPETAIIPARQTQQTNKIKKKLYLKMFFYKRWLKFMF